jgi:hypothetical protein
MWCRTCQQDVPGVASTRDASVRCARCQNELSSSSSETRQTPTSTAAESPDSCRDDDRARDTRLAQDDWRFDEDLQSINALLRKLGLRQHGRSNALDPVAQGTAERSRYVAVSSQAQRIRRSRQHTAFRGLMLVSWLTLAAGSLSFVGGVSSLAWALQHGRDDLWQAGVLTAFGGLAAVILGLVCQLDGLRRGFCIAGETLEELDKKVTKLRGAEILPRMNDNYGSRSISPYSADEPSLQPCREHIRRAS